MKERVSQNKQFYTILSRFMTFIELGQKFNGNEDKREENLVQ